MVKWAKVEVKDAGAAMAVPQAADKGTEAMSQAAGRWVRVDSAEAVKVAMGKAGEDVGWQAIREAVKWAKVGAKDAEAAMADSQVAVKGDEVGAIPRSG